MSVEKLGCSIPKSQKIIGCIILFKNIIPHTVSKVSFVLYYPKTF